MSLGFISILYLYELNKKEVEDVLCVTGRFAVNCVLYVFYKYSFYSHYANITLNNIWKANTIMLN